MGNRGAVPLSIPPEQAEVAAFLAGVAGEQVVETQISLVFLGDGEALKLKKAVALTFLDFRALDDRRRLLEYELSLNQPHAPGLYRDVVPVTRGPGGLAMGGDGAVVDWVLRMARLPSDAFLDVGPPLDTRGLDALADAVVALHAAAPLRPAADLGEVLRGNRDAGLAAGLDPAAVERWSALAGSRLDALRPWLASRKPFQRRCHCDLHLGNLCLMGGKPVPFDALEFDETLACIDTGYDLAFLLMDLDQRWGRAAANRVMNRYVARTGDAAMVRGLPFWLSLRAFIRAHVKAPGPQADGLLAAALGYLSPPAGRLVAIGGLQGTGKSTLARALAPGMGPAPGALVLRSDEIRKRRAGMAPEMPLPAAAYTAAEGDAVFAALHDMAMAGIAGGHAVIADAVFQRPAERDAIGHIDPGFQGLWLEAPLAVLHARIAARIGDASDATAAVLEAAAARDPGTVSWARIDADAGAEAAARKMLDAAPPASP